MLERVFTKALVLEASGVNLMIAVVLLILMGRQARGVIKDVHTNLKPLGLGDAVAGVAAVLGIKQSEGCGCKERQEKLNDVLTVEWN